MALRILYATCPLCDDASIVHEKTGNCSAHPLYKAPLPPEMHWKKCKACGHVFTEGYFSPEAVKLIFNAPHAHQSVGNDIENQRYIAAAMVEKVLPYADTGAWLDVGFGNGALLFTAMEYGFAPIGIDLSEDNVRVLSSLGISAHHTDITRLSLDSPCTVISMADVLKHMPFPKDGLLAAKQLLKDDGVLLISMPNSESMLWRGLDHHNLNPYWGEIEHYHNFTRSRLYSLLHETGFTPVKYGVSTRYRACMEVIARKKPR